MEGYKQSGSYFGKNGDLIPIYSRVEEKSQADQPVRPTMAYGAGPSTGNKRGPPKDDRPRKQAKPAKFKGTEVRPGPFLKQMSKQDSIRRSLGIVKNIFV